MITIPWDDVVFCLLRGSRWMLHKMVRCLSWEEEHCRELLEGAAGVEMRYTARPSQKFEAQETGARKSCDKKWAIRNFGSEQRPH